MPALCQVKAGVGFHLTLKAKDQHGNVHRSGGAIRNVVVVVGGRRSDGHAHSSGDPVHCNVEDISDGVYSISARLITVGRHDILVTDYRAKVSLLGTVQVLSNLPCGTNCKLSTTNTYTAFVGTHHCISVELFDEYENHAYLTNGCTVKMEASVGGQTLRAYAAPDAAKRGLVESPGSAQCVVFAFTPREPQQAALQVSINHTPLPECPVPFTVSISKGDLKAKFVWLRKYLKGKYCCGYTPTLTIKRDMLLESAVQALQEHHFSRIVRIRFGNEPGVDTGGIVK